MSRYTWVTPESHLSYTCVTPVLHLSYTTRYHVWTSRETRIAELINWGNLFFLCENITSWSYFTLCLSAVRRSQFSMYTNDTANFQIRGTGTSTQLSPFSCSFWKNWPNNRLAPPREYPGYMSLESYKKWTPQNVNISFSDAIRIKSVDMTFRIVCRSCCWISGQFPFIAKLCCVQIWSTTRGCGRNWVINGGFNGALETRALPSRSKFFQFHTIIDKNQWRIFIVKFWPCAPSRSNFLHFYAVLVKFSQVIGWHGTSPLENPGSTAGNVGNNKSVPPLRGAGAPIWVRHSS